MFQPRLQIFIRTMLWSLILIGFWTRGVSPAQAVPTFNKDIAPILFAHCSICHRAGQAAPFSLIGYEEVKKRGRQIVEVTASRTMPPWLPEPGHVEFLDERLLSRGEIDTLKTWVEGGSPEGNPADLRPVPSWPDGWQLGPPDLIVTMPKAYLLTGDGPDVNRNFVVPVPIKERRYVRAMEFRPGGKTIHHAFIKVDRTPQSRQLSAQNGDNGFPGMQAGASEMPSGHFLSWQPGRTPAKSPPGLAWVLEPGNDLVLKLHMTPSGRAELVQPQIGLYFTTEVPTNTLYKFSLASLTVDIPAGATNHLVRDTFRTTVDADLLAVLPHTHFLGRRLEGSATLPDGTRKPLLLIKEWNFNWQGDYRYAKPVFLPAGTMLEMNYAFDNSTNNIRNPNSPPKRVQYGSQSSDEMAELWFQFLPRKSVEGPMIEQDRLRHNLELLQDHYAQRISQNPKDPEPHVSSGLLCLKNQQMSAAEKHLRIAVTLGDKTGEAHYLLGVIWRMKEKLPEAKTEFEAAISQNPSHGQAHGNLGLVLTDLKDLQNAERHLRRALELNPQDEIARSALDDLRKSGTNP